MDLPIFGMDGEVVAKVLATAALLSLLIERALSLPFEWRSPVFKSDKSGLKEPLLLSVSLAMDYSHPDPQTANRLHRSDQFVTAAAPSKPWPTGFPTEPGSVVDRSTFALRGMAAFIRPSIVHIAEQQMRRKAKNAGKN